MKRAFSAEVVFSASKSPCLADDQGHSERNFGGREFETRFDTFLYFSLDGHWTFSPPTDGRFYSHSSFNRK
jgi:hypothetical protein